MYCAIGILHKIKHLGPIVNVLGEIDPCVCKPEYGILAMKKINKIRRCGGAMLPHGNEKLSELKLPVLHIFPVCMMWNARL